jgi:hypothetical protein
MNTMIGRTKNLAPAKLAPGMLDPGAGRKLASRHPRSFPARQTPT